MPRSVVPQAGTASARRRQAIPEDEIIRYISRFFPLNETDAAQVIRQLKVRSFKKGAFILREGQVAKLCYFVLKGCIRQYFLVDGEEKTTQFYTEGQPVTPYEGSFQKAPSKYYLACVEDTIVTTSTPEEEALFFQQFPHLLPARSMAVEEEWGKSQETLSSFLLKSPEERYRHLLQTRPDLLDRVPQYQLASYLGITPESLSRIRKRIMLK